MKTWLDVFRERARFFPAVSLALALSIFSLGGPVRAGAPDAPSDSGRELPPPSAISSRSGRFVDSAGRVHPWSIGPAHTLAWDGQPWIPVGVTFAPASLDPAAGADAFGDDLRHLDALHTAGIKDIVLGPHDGRLTDWPADRLQKILDALEGRGFHYGLDVQGRATTAVDGLSFGETAAAGVPQGDSSFLAPVPAGAAGGIFVTRDNRGVVLRMGLATLQDGKFRAAAPENTQTVSFVSLRHWGPAEGAENIWDSFPDVSDSVLFGLHPLRFGPGLRFILDPLSGPLTAGGRAAYFLPLTHRFQTEFEAWLQRKYADVQTLTEHWGLAPGALPDLRAASRLIPSAPVQTDALWDPIRGDTYPIAEGSTTFWSDVDSFRVDTTRHEMDLLAGSLRHNIADVPVVYRWQAFSVVYVPSSEPISYDGLAWTPASAGEEESHKAAYAYAQVADSNSSRWFFLAGTPGRTTLGALAGLMDLGAKGFFVTPDPTPEKGVDTTLTLLHQLGASLMTSGHFSSGGRGSRASDRGPAGGEDEVSYADYQPPVLWFPWTLQITSARRLPDGTWWLPSFRQALSVPVGPNLQAYQMQQEGLAPFVIWSATGPQVVRLHLPASSRILWPRGARFTKAPHGLAALALDANPVVLTGAEPANLFPADAVDQAMAQANQLRGCLLLDPSLKSRIEIDQVRSRRMADAGLNREAYTLLLSDVSQQRRMLLPYIWIEGESAQQTNFSGVAASTQCSGSAYLWLNSPEPPPAGKPFSARWSFVAETPGTYEMWLGGADPGQDWSSPVEWKLDGAPLDVTGHGPAGDAYLPLFHWVHNGIVTLSKGKHTLDLIVMGPRLEPDSSYLLGVDAIVFRPTDALVHQFLAHNGTLGSPAISPQDPILPANLPGEPTLPGETHKHGRSKRR